MRTVYYFEGNLDLALNPFSVYLFIIFLKTAAQPPVLR